MGAWLYWIYTWLSFVLPEIHFRLVCVPEIEQNIRSDFSRRALQQKRKHENQQNQTNFSNLQRKFKCAVFVRTMIFFISKSRFKKKFQEWSEKIHDNWEKEGDSRSLKWKTNQPIESETGLNSHCKRISTVQIWWNAVLSVAHQRKQCDR